MYVLVEEGCDWLTG